VNAFSSAFSRGLPHGVIAAIHLPDANSAIPNAVIHRLHADEQEFAGTLEGHRKVQWIGGRLAARHAARSIGADLGPLLTDPRGAPISPKSMSVSISHKEKLAVALVSKRVHGSIGVDYEVIGRDRSHIAEKILQAEELKEIEGLPDAQRWGAILVRFALKEATYKALAPRLGRYIAFDEASIRNFQNGQADLILNLKTGDGPEKIEALYEWMPEGLIATVRAKWD